MCSYPPGAREDGSARSAELHSAVSQIWNLRRVGKPNPAGVFARLAECNSAIRQIENLRYEEVPSALSSETQICATGEAGVCRCQPIRKSRRNLGLPRGTGDDNRQA